jgi:hypothetical protein
MSAKPLCLKLGHGILPSNFEDRLVKSLDSILKRTELPDPIIIHAEDLAVLSLLEALRVRAEITSHFWWYKRIVPIGQWWILLQGKLLHL